mmetsp:Transcript_35426/g.88386  ORF Transcript_35426/g.88386 Transcript_35426/m.88386 type:complete len:267 (+) Transcript_35426:646-1446(+)
MSNQGPSCSSASESASPAESGSPVGAKESSFPPFPTVLATALATALLNPLLKNGPFSRTPLPPLDTASALGAAATAAAAAASIFAAMAAAVAAASKLAAVSTTYSSWELGGGEGFARSASGLTEGERPLPPAPASLCARPSPEDSLAISRSSSDTPLLLASSRPKKDPLPLSRSVETLSACRCDAPPPCWKACSPSVRACPVEGLSSCPREFKSGAPAHCRSSRSLPPRPLPGCSRAQRRAAAASARAGLRSDCGRGLGRRRLSAP